MGRRIKTLLVAFLIAVAVITVPATETQARGQTQSMYSRCIRANSKTGWCLVISKSQHICAVYRKAGGRWRQVNSYYVTVGANGCTRSGTFKTGRKRYYMDFRASTAFYCIYLPGSSGYLHTWLYRKGSRNIATAKKLDAQLKADKSHGCVRFDRWAMYHLYHELPTGTSVVIY